MLQIKKINEVIDNKNIFSIVYGEPGVGKTTSVLNNENKKILYIVTKNDGGVKVASKLDQSIQNNIDVYELFAQEKEPTQSPVQVLVEMLSNIDTFKNYDLVLLDPLTELRNDEKEHVEADLKTKGIVSKNGNVDGFQVWDIVAKRLELFMNSINNVLNVTNVCIIMHEKVSEQEDTYTGSKITKVNVPFGTQASKITQYADLVIHMRNGLKGEIIKTSINDGVIFAKNRTDTDIFGEKTDTKVEVLESNTEVPQQQFQQTQDVVQDVVQDEQGMLQQVQEFQQIQQ